MSGSRVNDQIEVWSNSYKQWCCGVVSNVEGSIITARYEVPSGKVLTKQFSEGHKNLRHSPSDDRALGLHQRIKAWGERTAGDEYMEAHGSVSPEHETKAEEAEILPDDTVQWMWGDAGTNFLGHSLAEHDPLRWSNWSQLDATIIDLERYRDANRPVELRTKRTMAMLYFDTVEEALLELREQAENPAYIVNGRIEVWSNSSKQWCRGIVRSVLGSTITVTYETPSGKTLMKQFSEGHENLRQSQLASFAEPLAISADDHMDLNHEVGIATAICKNTTYKVNDRVEVWSNSFQKWCAGHVIVVDGSAITLKYQTPSGKTLTKQFFGDHNNLRHAAGNSSMKQIVDDIEELSHAGGFHVNECIEVWSSSHNQWCCGTVHNVNGTMIVVKYVAPTGKTLTKQMVDGHENLRHATDLTPVKSLGAAKLRGKGFAVEQLLSFYAAYRKGAQIKSGTTTNEVVRSIVIPETMDPPRCYMESDFMRKCGGPQVAKKLVSHAWKSEFVNTVLNIVMDASNRPKSDFVERVEWAGKFETAFHDGILEADFLLDALPALVLRKTYWLCTFAINEHHAICGDCWKCNKQTSWKAEPVKHLQANPCLICGQRKFNPCTCGSLKYAPGDPNYEIDLFDHVVGAMDGLVVSLDAELNSIKRVWVVAEIGKAMQIGPVFFRLCAGLAKEAVDKLEQGLDLMPSVEHCDAMSADDKERIISEIRKMDGGVPAYDNFINCMLEISFGICSRLPFLNGTAAHAMTNLQQLEMDFSWRKGRLPILEDCCSHFTKLRELSLYCHGCRGLTSIVDFGKGLSKCKQLKSASFNFDGCSKLTSIDELGIGLGQCEKLTSAFFNFTYCRLGYIDAFGTGLGKCHALTFTTFNFSRCSRLLSISALGRGLGQCQALASVAFDFTNCSRLAAVDEFGKGLGQCQALSSATFNFSRCTSLGSIDEFGQGLGQCQALSLAIFNFKWCPELTSVGEFGKGLGHCQALVSATFDFTGCSKLDSVDGLGIGLGQCKALTSSEFNFSDCPELAHIDEFGKGLGHCHGLISVSFTFEDKLTSIDELGRGLGRCKALSSASFHFSRCGSFTSIDEFGKGLAHCQALESASFDFISCTGLTSVDELGKGLGECRALAKAAFSFDDCTELTSINELGNGMGRCRALKFAKFDFCGCQALTSIDEFGKGLGNCQALESAEFVFYGCVGLTSIDDFGTGLGHCQALSSAAFNFCECFELASIDEFGKGVAQCRALTSATFNFNDCLKLKSIDEFGKGLLQCQALASATFEFAGCSLLSSIDEFGKGLGACQALTSVTFDFTGCSGLASVDEFGRGLGRCQALASAKFKFRECSLLNSICELGKGLGACQALTSVSFDFTGCSGLTSIDEFGNSLSRCQVLSSARFNFTACIGMTSIDGFGKGLRCCYALASATFNFTSCSSLASINEFGKNMGQCQALVAAVFSFSRCVRLTSIGEFGRGLGHSRTLRSASFDFSGCDKLKSVDEFGKGLGQCQVFQSMSSSVFPVTFSEEVHRHTPAAMRRYRAKQPEAPRKRKSASPSVFEAAALAEPKRQRSDVSRSSTSTGNTMVVLTETLTSDAKRRTIRPSMLSCSLQCRFDYLL